VDTFLEVCLHIYGANRKKQCVSLKSKVRELSRRLIYVLQTTDVLRQISTCVGPTLSREY
jgi:hypothetical protein